MRPGFVSSSGHRTGVRERHHHHDISLLRRLREDVFQAGEHCYILPGHHRAHFSKADRQSMRLKDAQSLLNDWRHVRLAKRIEADLR